MSDTTGNPLDDPSADPFEVAAAAAGDIARLTGVERHDIALTLGSGWGKAAELIGETTVIGGIYVSREQTSQDRTPALHRLPLLGWLFKRDEISDESRELLIFITPKILRL